MKEFWHLKAEDFFKELEAEKAAFLAVASRHRLKKNETVFLEGEEGVTCFYIESGLVRIFSASRSGKESTLFLRRKGEIFGLAELMNNTPRLASAQALKASIIYTMRPLHKSGYMTFCFVVAAIFDLFSAYFCIRSFVFHLFFAHFLVFGRTAPS